MQQAWVNLIGTVLFLIPLSYILIQASGKFAFNAWVMQEGSADPGGLPARYIVKAAIPVGVCLAFVASHLFTLSIYSHPDRPTCA